MSLSARQIKLLEALRDGLKRKQVNPKNYKVASHDFAKIKLALNVKTDAQAVAIAISIGLIEHVHVDEKHPAIKYSKLKKIVIDPSAMNRYEQDTGDAASPNTPRGSPMRITHKGMKLEAVKTVNGAYRVETEPGRYFIRVAEALHGTGWHASIWKHTNCFGGVEIVRNITSKKGGLVRRATARAMIHAALKDYSKA